MTSLNEFNDFKIKEEVDIVVDFNELDEVVGKLKRDLNNIREKETIKEKILQNLCFKSYIL